MNKRLFVSLLVLASVCTAAWAAPEKESKGKVSVSVSCIGFYNLENLFDTINDPTINDEQFLPKGGYKWTGRKYESKLKRMSYAISKIGIDVSPVGPVVLGVSEIENTGVLNDLVAQPALKDRNYQVVHIDGPDRRGVDVGLLYNPSYFTVTNVVSHPYRTDDPDFFTRDQLAVSGYLQGEKVHFIVIHWPSRWGGEKRSRPLRVGAAKVTRSICDSIYATDKDAKIMIMGDFNDDPYNEACAVTLNAKKDKKDVKKHGLYNPLWQYLDKGIGSLAYNNNWNLFDMILLSEPLANAPREELSFWRAEIFNKSFLLQQEGAYKGHPLRTHSRGVWTNGYSDHLPVIVYLVKKK